MCLHNMAKILQVPETKFAKAVQCTEICCVYRQSRPSIIHFYPAHTPFIVSSLRSGGLQAENVKNGICGHLV
jgi:hypothetical protein